jgi:pimeloyl-ACP methyl ester carboxylesterase
MSVHHFRQRTDLLPGSQIEVEGLRIAYRWSGEGLPLLLLHGFVGDSREWRRQIEDLSNEFTVVAWDAPGSGGSSDPPEAFRLADCADCLAEFIDTLGLGRPHVAGISFGGALALELYRRHPAQPLSLVLASAYAGWTGSLPAEIVEQRLQRTLQAAHLPPDAVRALDDSDHVLGLAAAGAGRRIQADHVGDAPWRVSDHGPLTGRS